MDGMLIGHFKGYKIETWTDKEDEFHAREMVNNASTAFVNKFVPHSVNFVRVRVINSAHQGPPSEVLSFTTPEGSTSSFCHSLHIVIIVITRLTTNRIRY